MKFCKFQQNISWTVKIYANEWVDDVIALLISTYFKKKFKFENVHFLLKHVKACPHIRANIILHKLFSVDIRQDLFSQSCDMGFSNPFCDKNSVENCEAMTSLTHLYAYIFHIDGSRNVSWKLQKFKIAL